MNLRVTRSQALCGEVRLPGDKSITHRALLLGAIADGRSRITGCLEGGDCQATVDCLRALGVGVERPAPGELVVYGVGLAGLREPEAVLDCARSGTTLRLLAGLLAGQRFASFLSGDRQLLRRPMERVVMPLRAMGAQIIGRAGGTLAPLGLAPANLTAVEHRLPVASAQVKSCLLLAGLYARGETVVIEPGPSRDHTERMLAARGAEICSEGLRHTLCGPAERLAPADVDVPGDLSSAAFLLVAALLVPGSEVLLRDVGLNPTRTGLLEALVAMGAPVRVLDAHTRDGEPVGDLLVRAASLRATDIGGSLVPRMIDEFPVLAVAATQAEGVTRVRDAGELRVKESDRIASLVEGLRAMGARIVAHPDGFDVEGPVPLRGARVAAQGDHRLAMALAVAGLVAEGETVVLEGERAADSFPGFVEALVALGAPL